ncbi:hypothetical protein SDC9_151281 [bioreactor metagenome]|uniref:Peptidase C51 domain-containing protein n=1 Tax=bioreactor metagenome TaxID=1076179 RepID=A0A645EPU8_9ZZZZ
MINWLKKYWYVPAGLILLSSSSVQSIVKKTIGIQETGGGSGFSNKAFEAEMKELGWQPWWSWCVLYAKYSWSHWLKGKERAKAMELLNANSQQTWSNFRKDTSGLFELSDKPKHVGAIAIWQGAVNKGTGHAGIVTKIPSDYKSFITWEGNYNNQVAKDITRYYNYTTANSEGLKLKGFINVKRLAK